MIFYTLLGLAGTLVSLISSLISRDMVDIITGQQAGLLARTFCLYIGFSVGNVLISQISNYFANKISISVDNAIKADIFEKMLPETLGALERYLGNGQIKGVGPATAKKIVEKFGKETVNIIKYDPLELSKIKGISKDKALAISESFIENWEVWQIVRFLEKFGVGVENAKRVYDNLSVYVGVC